MFESNAFNTHERNIIIVETPFDTSVVFFGGDAEVNHRVRVSSINLYRLYVEAST